MLDSLRSYRQSGIEEPIAKFEEGQVVYMVNDTEPLTIKTAIFNPKISIFQYTFEGKSFACGEQSIIANLYDEPYRLSECIWENGSGIVDEILKHHNDLNGSRGVNSELALEFFQPDQIFIEWIKEYANGRTIIDVGCGSGRVTCWLNEIGAKVCGIDPFFDITTEYWTKSQMDRIFRGKNMVHIFQKQVEECGDLIRGMGDKALLMFARPCHSSFVENALLMKSSNTEALYITLPENLELYNDLGVFDKKKELLNHRGFSVGREVVYSIK